MGLQVLGGAVMFAGVAVAQVGVARRARRCQTPAPAPVVGALAAEAGR
jgi:hypothetical protein